LRHHTGGADLGLRLRGEQLAAGVRFVRLVREGNTTSSSATRRTRARARLADKAYVEKEYPRGKADLYAAFLERGLSSSSRAGVGDGDDAQLDVHQAVQKRAAVLAQVGRHEFDPKGFAVIDGEPIVYWWSKEFLERYAAAPKLGEDHKALNGLSTQNNVRFIRTPTEIRNGQLFLSRSKGRPGNKKWCPYIKGGEGAEWFEPLSWTVAWGEHSGELRVFLDEYQKAKPGGFIKHEGRYFGLGVAFSVIGAGFSARAHRWSTSSSIFPEDVPTYLTVMNSRTSREVLQSLNPSVHFLASDVDRLPVPGPSPWRHAQEWAQLAVDRPEGAPLPPYEPVYDPEPPTDHLSFAIGVALGRFGANGEGILTEAPATALPHGILFLSDATDTADSLAHPAAAPILAAWATHGPAIDDKRTLKNYLQDKFFPDVHRKLYENRPIYFPLSSAKKAFVAYVSIHRWTASTLNDLLAEHLYPAKRTLEGEVTDLRAARDGADKKAAKAAEKRFGEVGKWLEELNGFIAAVEQCAERGPPPPTPRPRRARSTLATSPTWTTAS
jgi:hypothetical protein